MGATRFRRRDKFNPRASKTMTEIITALYDSSTTVTNVVDDLRATGIPNEKIRIHDEKPQVQVMSGEAVEPEIEEILQRHHPLDLQTKKSDA